MRLLGDCEAGLMENDIRTSEVSYQRHAEVGRNSMLSLVDAIVIPRNEESLLTV
jgi:hypothetical protein